MSVSHAFFRSQVLAALLRAKHERAGAHLHLLYTPELHDPLPEAADQRRNSALIHEAAKAYVEPLTKSELPRLITLDTRCVAPHLLEHDAGLDDPLLETSINQAYAEAVTGMRAIAQLNNSDPERAASAVGGWIVTTETALQMAQRITGFSWARVPDEPQPSRRRAWVCWTQPEHLATLWPTLTPEQCQALLGDAAWLTADASTAVRVYTANAEATPARSLVLSANQAQQLRNVPLVQALRERWQTAAKSSGTSLPDDAEALLRKLAREAQALRLGRDALAIYVLTAVQLAPGATGDPRWLDAIARAHQQGTPMLTQWAQLPAEFWAQWSKTSPAPHSHDAANT